MGREISIKGLKKNAGKQVLVWSEGSSVLEGELKSKENGIYLEMPDWGELGPLQPAEYHHMWRSGNVVMIPYERESRLYNVI